MLVEHEHVHNWEGGERRVRHSHPLGEDLPWEMRSRQHQHKNGRHAHPHGHDIYMTDEERKQAG